MILAGLILGGVVVFSFIVMAVSLMMADSKPQTFTVKRKPPKERDKR